MCSVDYDVYPVNMGNWENIDSSDNIRDMERTENRRCFYEDCPCHHVKIIFAPTLIY